MAKFIQSAIQTVLNLRGRIEEAKAIALRKSALALEREKEILERIAAEKFSEINEIKNDDDNRETLSLNQLQVSSEYVTQLNEKITSQTDEVDKKSHNHESNRNELLDASRNRKVVEMLHDRRQEEFSKSVRKKEEKNESEIALRISVGKSKAEVE